MLPLHCFNVVVQFEFEFFKFEFKLNLFESLAKERKKKLFRPKTPQPAQPFSFFLSRWPNFPSRRPSLPSPGPVQPAQLSPSARSVLPPLLSRRQGGPTCRGPLLPRARASPLPLAPLEPRRCRWTPPPEQTLTPRTLFPPQPLRARVGSGSAPARVFGSNSNPSWTRARLPGCPGPARRDRSRSPINSNPRSS